MAAKAAATSAAAKQAAAKDADDIDCLDEYHSDDESAGGSRREVDPEASSDDEEELDLPQQLEFPKASLPLCDVHEQLPQQHNVHRCHRSSTAAEPTRSCLSS